MEAGEKSRKTLKGQEEMKLPEGCERKGGKTLRDWGEVVWEKEKKNSQKEEKIGIGGG